MKEFADFFCGIGGFRLAFERAGCRCVFSDDSDPYVAEIYAENFEAPDKRDIREIETEELPPHDIAVGGFPCQPFSSAGISKRNSLGRPSGRKDADGNLFFELVRVLKSKKPAAFLLENVKNLTRSSGGSDFRLMMRRVREAGYSFFHETINARLLVPQSRERVFIVGFSDPSVDFRFPEIPDCKPKLAEVLEPSVDPKYVLSDHTWKYMRDYAEKHRRLHHGFGYDLADPRGLSRTLLSRYYKDGSEILVPTAGNPRRLTPRECARLMGFPDDFRFPVSETRAYKALGNAVVVPIATYLAKAVVDRI